MVDPPDRLRRVSTNTHCFSSRSVWDVLEDGLTLVIRLPLELSLLLTIPIGVANPLKLIKVQSQSAQGRSPKSALWAVYVYVLQG